MRLCTKCKISKPNNDFSKKRSSWCSSCRREYMRNYRQRNPNYSKQWRIKNSQHLVNYNKQWRHNNPQLTRNYSRRHRNRYRIPYVYFLRNKTNNQIIYVGNTSQRAAQRWYEHQYFATSPDNKAYDRHLYQVMRQIGLNNISFEQYLSFPPQDYTSGNEAIEAARTIEKSLIAELNPDGNERGRSDGFQY